LSYTRIDSEISTEEQGDFAAYGPWVKQ